MAANRGGKVQGRALLGTAGVLLTLVALALAVAAAAAVDQLDEGDPWVTIAQDVLKTAYQGLVVGALGGLLKAWIEVGRQRAATQNELIQIRADVINAVVRASHQLDTGRTLLRANRSVRTLSDVMTDIVIPARVQLRETSHELRTWHDSDSSVFQERTYLAVTYLLHCQIEYMGGLIDEYAPKKQSLSELQWQAEAAKVRTPVSAGDENARNDADAAARERRNAALQEVSDALDRLSAISGFIEGDDAYGKYRAVYIDTLITLRKALPDGELQAPPRHAAPSGWEGFPKGHKPESNGE